MKRRIALLYIGKSLNLKVISSSHYPTIRSVINILLEDPDNEITILTRNKVLPGMALRVNAVPMCKYENMFQTQEDFDMDLKRFLEAQTSLDFDVVLVFGELGLGDYAIHSNRYGEQRSTFNMKYYNNFRSTLHFIYTPLKILDIINFKKIYFVGQDKDFIGKYPPWSDQEKNDKTYFIDFNDEGITTPRTFGGFIPELMAWDFMNPMNWVGLNKDKKHLFSAGYHVTKNRIAFVKEWLSQINDPRYEFHLKRANKKIQAACSYQNDKGVLKFPDMVQKIANSRYSLVIGTVNNSPLAWTIRQHMNWALDTLTFFTNYDPEKILIHDDLDFFRINEPSELIERIEELEANPNRRDEYLRNAKDKYLNPERFEAMKIRWNELIK